MGTLRQTLAFKVGQATRGIGLLWRNEAWRNEATLVIWPWPSAFVEAKVEQFD